jgi:osmoprotectant transport system permease protein
LWQWAGDHLGLIMTRLTQHVELTAFAVVVGLAISLPLSIQAYRHPRLYPPITWVTGLLYTIPSLALFILLIPITGLTDASVEVGLISYTLLILIRNIVVGLRSVPEDVKEAAVGMGYTRRQLLWRVELPIAVPAIVAGVRVATVSTVGLVTVGFIIGHGALGEFIIEGLNRFFTPEVLVGAGLSVALALAADGLLLGVERVLTPWASASRTTRYRPEGGSYA